jgi:hypothetical protein
LRVIAFGTHALSDEAWRLNSGAGSTPCEPTPRATFEIDMAHSPPPAAGLSRSRTECLRLGQYARRLDEWLDIEQSVIDTAVGTAVCRAVDAQVGFGRRSGDEGLVANVVEPL